MKRYSLINNISGWVIFVIASMVYLLTMEPTASFWDCSEFISTAFKQEVGHPPGAPFFMLIGRFFTLFAGNDVSKVAVMVNTSSALASGATIMFLFWSITHFARRIFKKSVEEFSLAELIIVIGAGAVGALAYTFTDSFWFSAVEGEVYALSSLFTALVFWAMLKWEDHADEPGSNKWIILIAYLMGLSIGVHLLNLLAIPAIVFIYYFKKYPFSWKGVAVASVVAVVLLGLVMYGFIQGSIIVASWFELLFVNTFGLPYDSGLIFFIIILLGGLAWGIWYTHKNGKVLWNTALLCVSMLLLGYGSFAGTVIRSAANPPLNENNPENMFNLISYLDREQYGDRPLLSGQYFSAPVVDEKEGSATYSAIDGKYVVTGHKPQYVYDDRFTGIFPRMYSPEGSHVEAYKSWTNFKGIPIQVEDKNTGKTKTLYKPTFGENMSFFFKYQLNFMYFRYFMWNFAGRQNDIQGNGEVTKGNWISGIKFLDELRLGSQDNQPEFMTTNRGRNTYYMLPFLLGILGLMFHYQRHRNDFTIAMLLFFMTGIAIVIYLNQTPFQPRERDYAYAGSFYAFAIWIGLGVMSLYELIKKVPAVPKAVVLTLVCLGLVPGIMAKENWDDHDRSGRYTCRDFGENYLNSCAPNAIIFTNGDNDTFPLWYAQEVEGVRKDVRVANLSYLGADWYIEQMQRKVYTSDPLPFSMGPDQYRQGTRDIVYVIDRTGGQAIDLREGMRFLASDDPKTKQYGGYSGRLDHIPSKKFYLPIDAAQILKTGTVSSDMVSKIVPQMQWGINKNYITKSDMMVLDLIANNNWNRPVYFAVTVARDNFQGLDGYFMNEGMAYRLVPIHSETSHGEATAVNTKVMYDNVMNKFRWGGIDNPKVYLDENNLRMTSTLRSHLANLASALITEGKQDSARKVLDKCMQMMPHERVPFNYFILPVAEQYFRINDTDKAMAILKKMSELTDKELKYYFNLPAKFAATVDYDKQLSLQILAQIVQLTDKYGQKDFSKDLKNKFDMYYNRYATQMQMQMPAQQQTQGAQGESDQEQN